jgi:hypothetical protein
MPDHELIGSVQIDADYFDADASSRRVVGDEQAAPTADATEPDRPKLDNDAAGALPSLARARSAIGDAGKQLPSKYRFDATKYKEAESREALVRLSNDLVAGGVPKWVVQQALAPVERQLGRKGVRDWRHWHHQKAVDNQAIRDALGRMDALLNPAEEAARAVPAMESALKDLHSDLGRLESAQADAKQALADAKGRLAALQGGGGRFSAELARGVSGEIADLERQIGDRAQDIDLTRRMIADGEGQLPALRRAAAGAVDGSRIQDQRQRIDNDLKVIGGDAAFQAVFDQVNPGDRRGGLAGSLARAELGRAAKDYGLSMATGSISGWVQAIRTQDKARRLTFAQQEMPTPTARLIAGAMMNAFDADAYKQGMNAAVTTVTLPVTYFGYASGGGMVAAGVPHATAAMRAGGLSVEHGLSHATDGTGSNIGWGTWGYQSAMGKSDAAAEDPRKTAVTKALTPPSIPIEMRNGKIRDLSIADRHGAAALLMYLGPKVDDAKLRRGDAAEVARRDLRRDIFRADDAEDLRVSPKSGKVPADNAGERAANRQLREALFYPDTPDRDQILAAATPMQKLYAAADWLAS